MFKVLGSHTETRGTIADFGVELFDIGVKVFGEELLVSGGVFSRES